MPRGRASPVVRQHERESAAGDPKWLPPRSTRTAPLEHRPTHLEIDDLIHREAQLEQNLVRVLTQRRRASRTRRMHACDPDRRRDDRARRAIDLDLTNQAV